MSRWFIVLALLPLDLVQAAPYEPSAEQVAENVYAIIGPLAQRSADNLGLNNNLGFIVTGEGVILIDSGSGDKAAQLIERTIKKVTSKPVRWVINTGSQDHRWLGNDYFSRHGASTYALAHTVETQARFGAQQLDNLRRVVGSKAMATTRAQPARQALPGPRAQLTLGGVKLEIISTDAHFPGDSMVWLPKQRIVFSGDLVFVDRLLGILPYSSVVKANEAFKRMKALQPREIVPGHGRVCGIDQAQKESGDYYEFLVNTIGTAAQEMEPMDDVLDRYTQMPEFEHLVHYKNLHRSNMNQSFLQFEGM